jgi:hypothetical protein
MSTTVLPPDFSVKSILPFSLESIQTQNINSTVFGALITMAIWVLYGSYHLWKQNKNRTIFILNLAQAVFYLIKILAATVYVVFYKLDCNFRPYSINLPQIICYVLIYIILLKRLLFFAPFHFGRKTNWVIPELPIKIFFSIILVVYSSVILAGVITSTTTLTPVGKCRTVYELIYRQQYSIEIILEVLFATLLIIGLTKRSEDIRHTNVNIFTQLRENENLRFFSVFIIITLKIILSYNNLNLGFDVLSLTHFIDSLRSALIYWALKTEYNKVLKSERTEFEKQKNIVGSDGLLTNTSNITNDTNYPSRITNNGSRRAYQ